MITAEYPILEYDAAAEAHIEPARVIRPLDVPEGCVFCFFQEVISKLQQEGRLKLIVCHRSESGEHPLYELAWEGPRLAVMHPGVGAPFAAALLEEVIARGCHKFIVCGSCGVLDPQVACGQIIVPAAAVRDEGTSYHYLPPSREVPASAAGVAAIERVLHAHGCAYLVGKTWTTDAFYRETPARIQRRKAEGCLTVEMEAAAFFAVAAFRGVTLAQILYGGDDVGSEVWNGRQWHTLTSVREKLFWLAAEACTSI